MNYWLFFLTLLNCISQCDGNGPHFVFQSADKPREEYQHTVQNSKIIQKLLHSDTYVAPAYPYSSKNSSAYNIFNNHRACASWSTANYWDAALQLFGRAYPLHQKVDLPSEYKCFCTDSTHQYYIHDSERYAIMEQLPLYDYPAFWSFIQNYPDYQDCILTINDAVSNDCVLQQQLSSYALQRIQNEAQKIRQMGWQQEKMLEQQHRSHMKTVFDGQAPEMYQEASEYNDFIELNTQYGFGDSEYLKKRQAIIADIQHAGARYEKKSYTMPQSAKELLRKNGHDDTPYTTLYGNQLQQFVHQNCISLLEQTAVVSSCSVAHAHKDALVGCIDAAREYNQIGLTQKALHVTDFCRSLLNYGKAILTGVAQGVVGAAQDCFEHPVQTALCVAAGEYVFAYQLCKVVFSVAEIGIISLIDSERGAKKLHDYIQPLNAVIDAFYNKQVSLRDAVQGVTQCAVHWKAQNKLLGGLGKFYKTTKAKALEFVKHNPLASPEHYLVTPEGFVLKASLVAENNKLPSHCVSGKIGEAAKRELILEKVSTYEQARNQALTLIGEIDPHTSQPHIGRVGDSFRGKVVGRKWYGNDVVMRLDWDPIKGAHINIDDYRLGKGLKGLKIAIPFEGDLKTVESLLKHLQ